MNNSPQVAALLERGVNLPDPASVSLAPEVDPGRFSEGAMLYPGCRIEGADSAFGPGCRIGEEGPAVLRHCQLGAQVRFRSGFADHATFLDGADIGYGAHIRPGTLLEEHSSVAHCVGLKQTILLPYVTLGSLINFCDALMAGGTSPTDHSEVGSGYVHFNFTPHQDKATPSMIGDVPYGVRLDQRPIFLGGQGGLVGPCRIAYGVVLAAGQVCRRDRLDPDHLVLEGAPSCGINRAYEPLQFGQVRRILHNNRLYLGNLLALEQWYRLVRSRFVGPDTAWRTALLEGARLRLDEAISERCKRLDQLAQKLSDSASLAERDSPANAERPPWSEQRRFADHWPAERAALLNHRCALELMTLYDAAPCLAETLRALNASADYLTTIRSLPETARADATRWLASIVETACAGDAAEAR